MKKDILIDLDEKFSKSTINESVAVPGQVPDEVIARIDLVEKFSYGQYEVDQMTTTEVLQEYNTQLTSQINSLPDLDAILQEWSWRCDKGFPDYNSTNDRFKLQEVLDEMGIDLPFKRITEAPGDATASKKPISKKLDAINLFSNSFIKKLEEADKINQFKEYLNLFPGGDALEKVSDAINKICQNPSNESELVKIFKSKKNLKSILSIDLSSGIYARMYNIRPSGTGPGEILISWYVDGAMFQGGSVSYDIDYNGQHWEVKSLIPSDGSKTPEPIDPANYGKLTSAAGVRLTKDLQMFFDAIIEPYYENKLRDSIMTLSDSDTVSNKLMEILDIFERIPRTSAGGKTLLANSLGEMTESLFNRFYDSISQIHSKLPKSVKDTAKSSRIAVKTDTTDAQYWINPEDVNDIAKNAGTDKEISIKVGSEITDENKDAKIWLAKLMNNKFIKDPKYFVDSLRSIRDGFSEGKQGMIYLTPPGNFNITNGMTDFFTSHITRAAYRFSLKNQNRYANYKYAQEQ
jgi:hypothetical protein